MKKLFDSYKEWMELGTMGIPSQSGGGLCNMMTYEYRKSLAEMFKPDGCYPCFWASGYKQRSVSYIKEAYDFTPLRQSIVLLICAIHNELN